MDDVWLSRRVMELWIPTDILSKGDVGPTKLVGDVTFGDCNGCRYKNRWDGTRLRIAYQDYERSANARPRAKVTYE
eukprot:scaffold15399_cov108-Skeletonema_dohrnii-CCMP3373.AAC.6